MSIPEPKQIKNKNLNAAAKCLRDAFDRIEGEFSNIPHCCVAAFIDGRTYYDFKQSLKDEKDLKKLDKWGYVPCDKCFAKPKGRRKKIKLNGCSSKGVRILQLLQELYRGE